MRLKDKVALVTGAQQGIGLAVVERFLAEGAKVAANILSDGSLLPEHADLAAITADVSDTEAVKVMVAETLKRFGRIDILVNNAGIYPRYDFLEMTPAEYDGVMAVNLRGTFFASQAAARAMRDEGQGGSIVSLSSGAIHGQARGTHYAATKAGMLGLTRSMALELAPHNIRVNAVAPGLTDTAQPRYGHSEEQLGALIQNTVPMKRLGRTDEIADAVLFLASDEATFITGQTLHVNGGSYRP